MCMFGVWGVDMGFKLLEWLFDLLKDCFELQQIEVYVLCNWFDIQVGKLQVEGLVLLLGFIQVMCFINVFDFGYVCNSKLNELCEMGYEIGIEILLFDWGGVCVVCVQLIYMQVVDQFVDMVVCVCFEVCELYVCY